MVLMNTLPFWIVSFAVFALVAVAILVVGYQLKKKNPENRVLSSYLCFVLFLAFFTRFLGYNWPFNTFWDENYHVASAQKYIDHVMFMEPHPPLGKMIIALGEWMIHPNTGIDTSGFLTTDYIRDFPPGYSFLGVRFFPTLLSTLSVLVFFLILYRLSRNAHYSFLFSFFYIFENSMILHTRSAMLEGPQFFFMLVALLYFIVLFQKKDMVKKIEYFYQGLLIGLAVSVKVNSLILALVYPVLVWKDHWPEWKVMDWKALLQNGKELFRRSGKFLGVIALKAAAAVGGIAAVFCLTYYIHFALGEKVLQNRTYRASADYIQVLKSYQTANPLSFPMLLGESLDFTRHYEKGVPLWDPTKKDENGSPAFTWPVGYKSINYRWEKSMGRVAYFYYQGNPVVWFAGLFAVIIALGLVLAKAVFGFQVKDTQKLTLLGFFTFLYFFYMAVMSQIDRVLYLYHYLMPLIFAMIALYLLFLILFEELVKVNDKLLYYTVSFIALEVFAVFLFFSPFTYGIPLAASDFVKRAWMRVWDLKYLFF